MKIYFTVCFVGSNCRSSGNVYLHRIKCSWRDWFCNDYGRYQRFEIVCFYLFCFIERLFLIKR